MHQARITADEEVVDGVRLHCNHRRYGEIDRTVGPLGKGAVRYAERTHRDIVQELHLATAVFSENAGGEIKVLPLCEVDVEVDAVAHAHDDTVLLVTLCVRVHPLDGWRERDTEVDAAPETGVFDECGRHL